MCLVCENKQPSCLHSTHFCPLSRRATALTLLFLPAFLLLTPDRLLAAEPDWNALGREAGDLLQRLIRIDTTNPPSPPATADKPTPAPAPGRPPAWRETEAVRLLADELAKDGIESRIYESLPGRGNLVARLCGDGSLGGALVLAAHIDVVGVERDKWSVDPFAGIVKDGYLYGRGAIDDKGMAALETTALRFLAREKVPLGRDVILCLNADEESSAKFGMAWLLEKHPEALEGAAFALNEGGKVLEDRGRGRAIWIQTAEKQYLDLALTARGASGHSSRPLPDNAITTLARGLTRLGAHALPFRPHPAAVRFFRGMAALEDEPIASFMRNVDHPDPAIARRAAEALAYRSPLYASMLRTTLVPTILRAGIRENVLPSTAEANVNCRLLPGEDIASFVEEVKRALEEPGIAVAYEPPRGPEPPPSPLDAPFYAAIESAARRVHPGSVVVPFLSTGATDSRFLRAHGIPTYGLDPLPVTPEDGERIHGHDERLALSSLAPGMRLLVEILRRAAQARRYDVLVLGARVVDGTGREPFEADVGIAHGRIVRVGPPEPGATADRVLDAGGLVLAPGFIDLHTHADNDLVRESRKLYANNLTQGVTTVATGNCGSGPVDVGGYLATLDRLGIGVNVVHFVGHGAVRESVLGAAARAPAPEEMARMRGLVEAGMKAGAWGMSTGLQYVPGCHAAFEELAELARAAGAHGGIYVSHVRDERAGVVESVEEAIRIGEAAGVPVHVSHLKASTRPAWGKAAEACAAIEAARSRGLRVTADQYPYTAYSTALAPALLPVWSREGGDAEMRRRLDDPRDGPRIHRAIEEAIAETGGAENFRFASCAARREIEGLTLPQAADKLGKTPVEAVVQVLRDGGAFIIGFSMREEDVRAVMRLPWVATASDWGVAVPGEERPHPRAYGTFARKVGVYALEKKVLTLTEAVRSCTGLPAEILGIADRGVVREGAWADVVVFDPATYRDNSSYDNPHRYAAGVRWVLVNGVPAVADGKVTGAAAGRVLRKAEAVRTGGGEAR